MTALRDVFVPAHRFERWVQNFESGHDGATYRVEDGALHGTGSDGSWFTARLPFDAALDAEATSPDDLVARLAVPEVWGVLLVRKGGFGIARLHGTEMVEHKIGQRHVQGRTKAGGQSQQRFARRRDNQARQAYEAAADHAARILGPLVGTGAPVVVGGDAPAVQDVLADPRLRGVPTLQHPGSLADPRRAVLDQVIEQAQQIQVRVQNV